MSGGRRTPIFSFDTPSRRMPSSGRTVSSSTPRGSSAREVLDGVVSSDSYTPPPSRSMVNQVQSDALAPETINSTETG